MKDKYVIKIWETESDRYNGTPFELLIPKKLTIKELIDQAKEYFEKHSVAAIEVQDSENENNPVYFRDSEEERYIGEGLAYKPFEIKETLFYKYFKQELDSIKESYDNPKEHNLDKLQDKDMDKIIDNLLNDNFFNQSINNMLQEELENYASKLENEEEEEI